MSEKKTPRIPQSTSKGPFILGILSASAAAAFVYNQYQPFEISFKNPFNTQISVDLCPQLTPILPTNQLSGRLESSVYADSKWKESVYEKLGGAVRIPTESYDDLLPVSHNPPDSRWDIFGDFHKYLETTFPRIYASEDVKITKVNTWGLVFEWGTTNPTVKKPILLTAHQDVVPVPPSTVDDWTYPPYSGRFDGEWIWGRGSVDDKADLIAQLVTIDTLLGEGFQPTRPIVLAYGIDEESSGNEGAGKLAGYLEERFGKDGFALILDEGEGYTGGFALPGISEKGYLDVEIAVSSPGGHSSVPPKHGHTSIGFLALATVALEKARMGPQMMRGGAGIANAECRIEYGTYPNKDELRKLLVRGTDITAKLIEADPFFDVLLKTTQAVDIVHGGLKINALPEQASVVVNYRIAEHSSTQSLREHITETILPVATENNLTLNAFGVLFPSTSSSNGVITLSDAYESALEPSPVSPVNGAPYKLLSGTIRSMKDDLVVVPSLGLGNTDTRSYWNLTRHIFRYSHREDKEDVFNGLHTVNEALRAESIINEVKFFTRFILNCDESEEI